MMAAIVVGMAGASLARERHRAPCHFRLGLFRAACQLFDRMPVAIARREVHAPIGLCRIPLEDSLDDADLFDEDRPVARRHQPHRRDDVADGELIGGFALVFAAQQHVGRVALRFQGPVQALPRRPRRRRLIAQPLQQLDDEGRGQGLALARGVAQQVVDDPFRARAGSGDAQAQAPRSLTVAARRQHVLGEPAQLVDQRDPQHDRDRPQLADVEGDAALVGADVADERLQVEASGRVRHEIPRQREDARVAGVLPAGQLRQLEVVLARQILADGAHLILDDVVVVSQPVFRGDRLRGSRRGGQEVVGFVEELRILVEQRNQRAAARRIGRTLVQGGQRRRVRFELLLAEQEWRIGPVGGAFLARRHHVASDG